MLDYEVISMSKANAEYQNRPDYAVCVPHITGTISEPHQRLCDHVKFVGCLHPVPSPTTLAFDYVGHLGTSETPHPPILVGRWFSRFT